jgi:hypothetical protein
MLTLQNLGPRENLHGKTLLRDKTHEGKRVPLTEIVHSNHKRDTSLNINGHTSLNYSTSAYPRH